MLHRRPTDSKTELRRLNSLQALRAFAALIVVLVHCDLVFAPNGYPHGWLRAGTVGVDIFFAISGFIMAIVTARVPPSPTEAVRFLLKRAGRLFPAYWLMTAGFIAAGIVQGEHFAIRDVFTSIFLIPNIYGGGLHLPIVIVAWTLGFEVWFYLLMAAAMAFRLKARGRVALVSAVVGACVAAQAIIRGAPSTDLYYYGMPAMADFPLGAVLGLAVRYWRLGRLGSTAVLGLATVLMATGWTPLPYTHGVVVVSGAALSVWGAIGLENLVDWRRGLPRVLVVLGNISYSLYLVHMAAIDGTAQWVLPPLHAALGAVGDAIWCGIVVGAAIGLAFVLHHAMERPANRLISDAVNARYRVARGFETAGQERFPEARRN